MKSIIEMLQGIKAIKLNFWQTFFEKRVASKRYLEMISIRKQQIFTAILNVIGGIFPVIVIFLTFKTSAAFNL
jgi:hypothetical protein